MKKLYLLILAFIFSFSASSQLKIDNEYIKITLPKGAKKSTGLLSRINEDGTIDILKSGMYESNGLFFDVYYNGINGDLHFLDEIKSSRERRRTNLKIMDTYYESSIELINKNKFLITRSRGGDFNSYWFDIVNQSNTYHVTGFIPFCPGEEKKAKKMLFQILRGITFLA